MSNKNSVRYYSVPFHKAVLIFYLILFFCFFAMTFPWILKSIYSLFSSLESFTGEADATENISYLSLLPDFLGGLCGILIAALLDSVIISRLTHLKNYQALISVLWDELSDIRNQIQNIGSDDGILPGDILPTPILSGIANSHESMSIIYNIPRCFFWEKKGAIAKEICELSTTIENLNNCLSLMMKRAPRISAEILKIREINLDESEKIQAQGAVNFFAACCNNDAIVINEVANNFLQLCVNFGIDTVNEEITVLKYLGKNMAKERADCQNYIDTIEHAIKKTKINKRRT